MNSLCFNNKIIFVIVFILFSVFMMPHASVNTYENTNYENLAKLDINNKLIANSKKAFIKIKSFLHKIFRVILTNIFILAKVRLILFAMLFFKVFIFDLFYFLCFYFHGSKYKHSINRSNLLLLMVF